MRVGLAVLALLVLAACRGSASTELRLDISGGGSGQRSYVLTCDPAGGTHPKPEAACDALEEHNAVMLRETRSTCIGGIGTIHISVTGKYRGQRVQASPDLCSNNAEGEELWMRDLAPLEDGR